VGTRGNQDRHEDVVVGVADVIAGRLLADNQRLHVDAGHEVRRPEDDRLHPRRCLGDRVYCDQALGVLDLRLNSDPPYLVAESLLDLGDEQIQRHHLLGALHLRQHDRVEVRTGSLDYLDNVPVGPMGGPIVDPDNADLVAPAALVQRGHDVLARPGLRQWRTRILQVEEHLVSWQTLRLLQETRVAPGDSKVRASGPESRPFRPDRSGDPAAGRLVLHNSLLSNSG
jgi:hypothetical protein